jgi:predicted RNase H-like HicB family nuclease
MRVQQDRLHEEWAQAMEQNYTAVIKEDAGWWIGWIEEVPGVNCQEATREALIETLRVTLKEALELNRQDAIGAAGGNFEEAPIAV